MPRYKLVVMTEPVEGREAEFNAWYQNTHLADIVALKDAKSAQRFRRVRSLGEDQGYPYLAIYEFEGDSTDGFVQDLMKATQEGRIALTDALGSKIYAVIYEEAGPIVTDQPGG